jgi:dephospho-CoA kinase
MSDKTLLIGITGGIGAGKTVVSELLRKEGYPVLSADVFARKITEPGSPAVKEIAEKLGKEFVASDGSLKRAELRAKITTDEKARKILEEITHPKIQALTKAESERLFAEGNRVVFYEAPLLFEAKSDHAMDLVICVAAEDTVRIERVKSRDKVSEKEAKKLLDTQMPQAEKVDRANFVIWNNDDQEKLWDKIEKVLSEINRRTAPASS